MLNNNLNSTFNGLKRVDHPDYPEYALREALLKEVCVVWTILRSWSERLYAETGTHSHSSVNP